MEHNDKEKPLVEKQLSPAANEQKKDFNNTTNLAKRSLSVKGKPLLLIRGILIGSLLYIVCPWCDRIHTHEWDGYYYSDEEDVEAPCADQPYRIAPIKKKDLAMMEKTCAEFFDLYLPLTKLAIRGRCKPMFD